MLCADYYCTCPVLCVNTVLYSTMYQYSTVLCSILMSQLPSFALPADTIVWYSLGARQVHQRLHVPDAKGGLQVPILPLSVLRRLLQDNKPHIFLKC